MKRIISFFMVFIIILSFVIPTYAEELYTLTGEWVLTSVPNTPTGNEYSITGKVKTSNSPTWYSFDTVKRSSADFLFRKNGSTVKSMYSSSSAFYVNFGKVPQEVPKEFYDAFIAVAQPMVCDGSTCPATDMNMDNICDDCGMTFAVLRDYTPSDFPSGYPPVPSLGNPDARYYMYKVHSSGFTYIVAYPSTVTPTYDTSQQNGLLYFSESYGNYRLDSSKNEWVLSSDDSPYTIGGTNNNSVDILYSSVQIKDQNGDNFFPIPLWEKVEKVTKGEIPTLQAQTAGTMRILVVCGVGLTACLVACALCGKVLRRFLL